MKTRRRTKTIMSAIVAIILSITTIVGQSFALFTSTDKVDISVTAGKINITASIDKESLKVYSKDAEQKGQTVDGAKLFENNGTASFDQNDNLVLERVTPGDKATFDIIVTNNSNVEVMYRVIWAISGDLAPALTKTVDEENIVSSKSAWTKWDITTGYSKTLKLSIELPITATNDYQETNATVSYSVEVVQANADIPDEWDGTVDTSWYNDTDTEFTLDSASELAGLASLVNQSNMTATIDENGQEELRGLFYGKTIKLEKDFDLYVEGQDGEPVSFEPIGSYVEEKAFDGTFDGQGHTISNMYQNGWALGNGYWDGDDYGMGLFALLNNATIKNLNIENASLPTEANIIGTVAGVASGDCVFENIKVTNSYLGNHSWYSGGLVGWASGKQKYINIDIDESNAVSSQWGDFNNANGGIIGGIDSEGTYYFENCNVACVIDAYNDVTSAYEWYSYRNCGMLIGDTGSTKVIDGTTYADAPNVTCKNVTVTYGNWANYHYCEFSSSNYPFCRVEAGESTGAYGNARVGEYYDANGNKVVDDNHAHNDGEKHNELIVFDQLFGGPSGDRYCTYGTASHEGVTVVYNNK